MTLHRLVRLRLGTPERPWSDATCQCGWTSGQWTIDRAAEARITNADMMEARLRADHEAHAERMAQRHAERVGADFYA